MGTKTELEKLTLADCKSDFARRYQPRDAIISVAGKVDFVALRDEVEKHFGDWKSLPPQAIKETVAPGGYCHEEQKSEQTHIGIAYPSVPETDKNYYVARMAVEILSGGMSGRLFTEIREKRGLVYSVSASYFSLKGTGGIMGYAGTSNDRAQATLDCFIAELHRLADGVTAAELNRAQIGLKASTIMQGESTSARSGAIAHDFFMRGRIRTLDEVKSAIESVTLEQVNAYLAANKPKNLTIVTVGPSELRVP
jgi:predicted Zn-dependent peptidase